MPFFLLNEALGGDRPVSLFYYGRGAFEGATVVMGGPEPSGAPPSAPRAALPPQWASPEGRYQPPPLERSHSYPSSRPRY